MPLAAFPPPMLLQGLRSARCGRICAREGVFADVLSNVSPPSRVEFVAKGGVVKARHEGRVRHGENQVQHLLVQPRPKGQPIAVAIHDEVLLDEAKPRFGTDVGKHEFRQAPGFGILRNPDFVPSSAGIGDVMPRLQARPKLIEVRPALRIVMEIDHDLASVNHLVRI